LIIITATSIPSAIESGASFPGFVVGIIVVGLGTGGIKSNVSPLVAEQYKSSKPYIKTLKSGERVIVTPQATYVYSKQAMRRSVSTCIILLISSCFGCQIPKDLQYVLLGYQRWWIVIYCHH
jgi:dipeptide/tripeptide permease